MQGRIARIGFSRLAQGMAPPVAKTVALLLLLATMTLAACGGDDADLLPGRTAGEINANLDAVRQLSDEGDCVGAESAAQQVAEQVEALEEIDPRLKRALREGAARLQEVVGECEAEEEEEEAEPTEEEGAEFGAEGEEEARGRNRDRGEDGGGGQGRGKAKGGGREEGPPPSQGKGERESGGKAETPAKPETPAEGGGEPPSGGIEPGTPVEGEEE